MEATYIFSFGYVGKIWCFVGLRDNKSAMEPSRTPGTARFHRISKEPQDHKYARQSNHGNTAMDRGLHNLEQIDFSSELSHKHPSGIEKLSNIRSLRLSNNPITTIPSHFQGSDTEG